MGVRTFFLSLFVSDKATMLFIVGPDSQSPDFLVADWLDEEAWNDIRRRFRREVAECEGVPRTETWDLPIRRLLIEASPYLNDAGRLVVVPHYAAYSLPWQVIVSRSEIQRTGADPSDLMPVITLPCISLLPALAIRRPNSDGPVIVIGDPLGDLPNARQEALIVADLLKVRPLIGRQADVHDIEPVMSKASLLHFATHAFFVPGFPLDSSILFAYRRSMSAGTIMMTGLTADLVILSACETGVTERISGEEVAGLATALLCAGARSVVLSLWRVDDRSTGQIMQAFYERFLSGEDKAEALAGAMARVRGMPEYSHSYHWGSFTLMM
jgi:hypothetical protein